MKASGNSTRPAPSAAASVASFWTLARVAAQSNTTGAAWTTATRFAVVTLASFGAYPGAREEVGLLVAFRLADALAQDLEQPVGNLGVLLEEGLEAPFRDGRQCHIRVRLDGRAAAFVVEQSHLPERVAGPKLAGLALDGVDGHRAIEDDHESDAVLALYDDLVTGRMPDRLHLLFHRAQLRVRQSAQQLRFLDVNHPQDTNAQPFCRRDIPGSAGRRPACGCRRSSCSPAGCSGWRGRGLPGPAARRPRSPRAGWSRPCGERRGAI